MATIGRNLDLLICLLALPVFIFGELPLLGWAGTTFAWTAGRVLQNVLEGRAATEPEHRKFFGYMAGSLIGRSWLLALTIFAVGIVDRSAGLAAALLALVVFTAYLLISLITQRGTATGTHEAAH